MTLRTVFRSLDEAALRVGRCIADVAPAVTPGLLAARDKYVRAYEASTRLRNRIRYDAPPNPHSLVEFNPARIERVAGDARPMYRRAGVVEGGDWDRVDERFEDTDVYRAYEAHFERGVPWRETDFYDRVVDEIASGQTRWGCESQAAFDARCERLDDLYDAIASEGFRSQATLATDGGSGPLGEPPRLPTERRKEEVAVHVDRDGNPLFADGRNRLAIAKLLDLDSIPVRVLRRHADWQAIRDAFARGYALDVDPNHPDLPDRWSAGNDTSGG